MNLSESSLSLSHSSPDKTIMSSLVDPLYIDTYHPIALP